MSDNLLRSVSETPTLEDFISLADLVGYLGVAPETVIRLHGLRHIKLGRSRVYARAEVAAWLKRRQDGS